MVKPVTRINLVASGIILQCALVSSSVFLALVGATAVHVVTSCVMVFSLYHAMQLKFFLLDVISRTTSQDAKPVKQARPHTKVKAS